MDELWRKRFRQQRKAAKERNIDFLLTYEEWLEIWQDSGHLHERGVRKGQYVMARFGDVGPYSVCNVKIITADDNRREGHFDTMTEWHKKRIQIGYRKKFPEKPKAPKLPCECGCGIKAASGSRFIHGHAGRLRFLKINASRVGKPRAW